VLFKGGRDGGFARGGEAGKPDCEAALLAVGVALAAGERRVPCDVAVPRVSVEDWNGGVWWGWVAELTLPLGAM
jgi:hypothetical protein